MKQRQIGFQIGEQSETQKQPEVKVYSDIGTIHEEHLGKYVRVDTPTGKSYFGRLDKADSDKLRLSPFLTTNAEREWILTEIGCQTIPAPGTVLCTHPRKDLEKIVASSKGEKR
jgi:hypothetical protein